MADLPVYPWGEWPAHLLTKKQMDEAGYQTGAKLPPPAGYVRRAKSPGGIMYLYDVHQGVPKRALTEAQKSQAALRGKALAEGWRCQRCGRKLPVYVKGGGSCWQCNDRDEMSFWAMEILSGDPPALILDTETTGLSAEVHEIIQIAVIDTTGAVLLDTLIQPLHVERMFEAGSRGLSAHDVHGITAEVLADSPTFPQVYPQLRTLLQGRRLVIYNASFDLEMLAADCERHGLPLGLELDQTSCAMLAYSQWVNEWSEYHEDYRWQPLNGGHTALADCQATLRRIRQMAAEENEGEVERDDH